MSVKLEFTGKLLSENFKLPREPLPAITWADLEQKGLVKEVIEVYRNLGGLNEKPGVLFPAYDLEFEDMAIQLDEEENFNRYRAITLQSSIYAALPNFGLEKYRMFCKTFEQECLKSASFGHHWTNSFAEKEFGSAREKGDLYKEGAPAWKYRAFQDFLLDLTPIVFGIKCVRFSIYDNILINNKMYRVNEIILSSRTDLKAALKKNFERRISVASQI